MAMTLSELERYMIAEIENLHAKLDEHIAWIKRDVKEMRARTAVLEQLAERSEQRLRWLEERSPA